jgi:hypothetical protein
MRRVLVTIAILVAAWGTACADSDNGDGPGNNGGDSNNGEEDLVIADGPVSGRFADEDWTYTRGITGFLSDVELCADEGSGCDPCEGLQVQFDVPESPGTVELSPGGPIVNFYDGAGRNINASDGRVVLESVDDETYVGSMVAAYPRPGGEHHVSGHFEVTRCP